VPSAFRENAQNAPGLEQGIPGASQLQEHGAIEIGDVVHRFSESVLAVSHVTLHIAPGEFVSIVGPSGCGKTTLLNLVAGLLPVQEGSISVAGTPPRAGRYDVAYMLARDSLLPWLDALQNAGFGAEIRNVPKEQRDARARELLTQVGLGGFEHAYPKALSHGMRQRVALARTFCLESPILLMDEPFGALDAQTKLQLEEVLLSLWTGERRTVVFITHDLSEAVALSDRVVVMSARPGTIIADIKVDLPRPRSVRALQRDACYHDIYATIWSKLELALEGT
jgi:NitT/TauT family transport system ATP-binding protein